MGRLADAAAQRVDTRASGCSVGHLVASLDGDDRDDLVALLDDSGTQHATIHAVLRDVLGVKINQHTIGRHRAGKCSCGPTV